MWVNVYIHADVCGGCGVCGCVRVCVCVCVSLCVCVLESCNNHILTYHYTSLPLCLVDSWSCCTRKHSQSRTLLHSVSKEEAEATDMNSAHCQPAHMLCTVKEIGVASEQGMKQTDSESVQPCMEEFATAKGYCNNNNCWQRPFVAKTSCSSFNVYHAHSYEVSRYFQINPK